MKLNNLDLNKIAVFCQVIDSGSYRAASEALNVTPSALSQTISNLEHSLGFPLFHRVGKRLVATENGTSLHREFRTYHGRFSEAVQKLANEKNEIQGIVRVGAYLEFAKANLASVISDFLKAHPQTQVKLVFETPSRLHRLLEKGQIDLCFSIYPSGQTRVIESRPVYNEELVLVSPKGLLSDKPSFDSLLKVPMIEYYMSHQPIRRWIALHYKKKPKSLPIRTFASTAEMVLALVKEGAGVGVVPQFVLASSNALSAIKIIRPTDRKFVDHIWMLEQKTSAKRPVHAAFSKFVSNKSLS